MIKRTSVLGTVSAVALAAGLGATASAALAQNTSSNGQDASALPEITVTASRISENIQTVPSAISALSGQQLAKKNVQQLAVQPLV